MFRPLIFGPLIFRTWTRRASQIIFVAVFAIAALGATDPSAQLEKDSHAMMCVCGCNELLGECNHVSCPSSGPMLSQLNKDISQGKSDSTIFHEFQDQYGPVVLAAPMFTRFNHLAWIMPPLLLFLGIGAALLVVRKWKLHTVPMPLAQGAGVHSEIRDRIRRETQL
jgi:cytochrome c-type biogenesis protein CcmH/NrfF